MFTPTIFKHGVKMAGFWVLGFHPRRLFPAAPLFVRVNCREDLSHDDPNVHTFLSVELRAWSVNRFWPLKARA